MPGKRDRSRVKDYLQKSVDSDRDIGFLGYRVHCTCSTESR